MSLPSLSPCDLVNSIKRFNRRAMISCGLCVRGALLILRA